MSDSFAQESSFADLGMDSSSVFDRAASHPNPAFDFITGFVPRKLKDLFKWTDYLFYNSAHIFAALKKYGEIAITNVQYNTTNDALRKKYSDLYEKKLHIKGKLQAASLDKQIYGNHFTSFYLPFRRLLKCPKCSTSVNIKHTDYKYDWKKVQFRHFCPRCRVEVTSKVVDFGIKNPAKVNIIRWAPQLMDIEYNPISNESVYYYNIPEDFRAKVIKGSKHIINSTPLEFLKAVKDNVPFEFAPGKLFHLKAPAPSGIDQQWGFPPLTSTLKLFLYTMILRKANEAIALEHIIPFRIIHPAEANGGNPLENTSMERWQSEMKFNLRRFRRDPLHIMFAPFPAAVTNIGGDGRAMLTLGEVQEAEKNIMAALGLPPEFLFGGLTKAGMEGNLRLIENSTQTHADDMNDLLRWYGDNLAAYLNWEPIDASLTPIKLIDDEENKQLVVGLATGPEKHVSMTTLFERLDMDYAQEQKLIMQEQIDSTRRQLELEREQKKLQTSISAQAQSAAAGEAGTNYDVQAVMQKADEVVAQLSGVDPGTRKSQLHQLQIQDYVMYAVVVQRLEDQQTVQAQQARAQVEQQGQQGAPQ